MKKPRLPHTSEILKRCREEGLSWKVSYLLVVLRGKMPGTRPDQWRFDSQELLAEEMGVDARTVRRAMKEAKRKGLLRERPREGRKHNQFERSLWVVNPDSQTGINPDSQSKQPGLSVQTTRTLSPANPDSQSYESIKESVKESIKESVGRLSKEKSRKLLDRDDYLGEGNSPLKPLFAEFRKWPKEVKWHFRQNREEHIEDQAAQLMPDVDEACWDKDEEKRKPEAVETALRSLLIFLYETELAALWNLPELKSREAWERDPKIEIPSRWRQFWEEGHEPDLE
jgi:DNA-binding transcriptional regulator YhcF (GntR family)